MTQRAKRYNTGKIRYELIPSRPLALIAEVYTKGAHKYTMYSDGAGNLIQGKDISIEEVAARKLAVVDDGADNWRKGQDWLGGIASLKRHIAAYESGEDFDPELGTYHLASAGWQINSLLEYYTTHPELDNRKHKYLNRPKIGLDIDEVLADFVGAMMERFPDKLKERSKFWNCPILSVLFNEVALDESFWLNIKPKISANELTFEPHCYITSRTINTDVTKRWLDANGFPSAPVHTIAHGMSKVQVAKDSGLDWFVDDRMENFIDLNKNGVCCYLMDAPHNQRYDVGYKRVRSLKELV